MACDCDKLTFSLLDVSQTLSEQLPAPLRLLHRHAALLEPLGNAQEVYLVCMVVASWRAVHLVAQFVQNEENVVLSLNDLAHFSVCGGWLGLSGQLALKALLGVLSCLITFISIR